MNGLKQILSKVSLKLRRVQGLRKLCRLFGINISLYPSGHYYSPIVDVTQVVSDTQVFTKKKAFPGIDLRIDDQLSLIDSLSDNYRNIDFPNKKTDTHLYYYNNPYFSYSDAIILHLILVKFRPKNIVEIGSGYSTACMLDTIAQYNLDCHVTTVDQDTTRLSELLITSTSSHNISVIKSPLQEVDIAVFKALEKDDILFVDSSHISKTGSELHKIIFDVLPALKRGVIIHFHDIFQNFEYPKEWIDEGISFNESYLLRAFLQYNSEFKILLYLGQLQQDYPDVISDKLPISMQPHERYTYGLHKGQYIESILGQSLYIIKQ